MLMVDYSDRKRPERTGGTRLDQEYFPLQCALLPPSPSHPMLSGDSNHVESGSGDLRVAGIANVPMVSSQVGVVPGVAGIQPHASVLSVPAGSVITFPLKLKVPRERPPRFSRSKGSSHRWVQSCREYAGINGFIRVSDVAVSLDMSNHNLSIEDPVREGFCDRDLEDGKNARWVLLAVSPDRTYMGIVNTRGVIPEASAKLLVVSSLSLPLERKLHSSA